MDRSDSNDSLSFLARLDRWPIVHTIVRVTRVRYLIRWILSRFPIVRTLEDSGVTYRVRSQEGFLLVDEIFNRGVYDSAVKDSEIHTFIDLGCNAGFFPCLLAHRTLRSDFEGLAIDANEQAIQETRWHLDRNKLTGVKALLGLAGAADPSGADADFYICPSDMGSSQFPVSAPGETSKGEWEKRTVPTIEIGEVWAQHFGDKRVNLLKVDIEGSEESFLKMEEAFLANVDAIVLEVHHWLVDPEEVRRILTRAGFTSQEVLIREHLTEILYCRRP
jgi:FkbM family methyltransferase